MNQNFEHHSYSIQSKLGILIFDEMKIKEGLIWSQHNNQLLGFTDVECMQDRSDEEFLASNVFKCGGSEMKYIGPLVNGFRPI
jgi:hypothetical protein